MPVDFEPIAEDSAAVEPRLKIDFQPLGGETRRSKVNFEPIGDAPRSKSKVNFEPVMDTQGGTLSDFMRAPDAGVTESSPLTQGVIPSTAGETIAPVPQTDEAVALAQIPSNDVPFTIGENRPISLPRVGQPGTLQRGSSDTLEGLVEWGLNHPEEALAMLSPLAPVIAAKYLPGVVKQFIQDVKAGFGGDREALGRALTMGALVGGPAAFKKASERSLVEGKPGADIVSPQDMALEATLPGPEGDALRQGMTGEKRPLEVPVKTEEILPVATETFKGISKQEPLIEKGVTDARKVEEAAALHGDVLRPAQEGKGPEALPVDEGQPGVRPEEAVAAPNLPEPPTAGSEVKEPAGTGEASAPMSEVGPAMGANVYGQGGEPLNAVSNMKAVINADRSSRGEPPMPETEPRTWSEDRVIAEGRMKTNPNYIPELIQDHLESRNRGEARPLTSSEVIAANLQRAYWEAELSNAWRRVEESRMDGREADRLEAQMDADTFKGQLSDMDRAFGTGGGAASEAGRSLAAQQAGITDDLDIVRVRMEKEESLGRPLHAEEVAALEKQVAEFKAAKETLAKELEKRTEEAAKATAERLISEARAETAEKALPTPQVMRFISEVRKSVKSAADVSRDYFKGKTLSFSPEDAYHLSRIALDNLLEIGEDFARWSSKMIQDVGSGLSEKLKPELQMLFDQAKEARYSELEQKKVKRTPGVKKVLIEPSPAQKQSKIVDALKESVPEGIEPNELRKYIRSIIETVIEEGEMEHDAIFQKTGDVLRQAGITLSKDDLQRIYGGYGLPRAPAPNERVPKRMAELRGEAQKFQGLKTVIDKNTPPLSSGGQPQRVKPSDLARRTAQQIHEEMQARGVATRTTESQLAGALDARKNYRRNRMKDLRHEMATGKRIVGKKSIPLTDPELQALDREYQALKAEHAAAFPKQPLTDAQRVAIEMKSLDREIAAMEEASKRGQVMPKAKSTRLITPELEARRARLQALKAQRDELRSLNQEWNAKKETEALERQRIDLLRDIEAKEKALKSGTVSPEGQQSARPAHPSIEPLLQQRDALNRQIAAARRKTPDQKVAAILKQRLEALNKNIDRVQAKIDSGDFSAKAAQMNRPMTPELEAAKQRLEAANKRLSELRKAPPKSRDQIASEAAIRYANNKIAEMQGRIALGYFDPIPKPPKAELNSAAQAARAKMAQVKLDLSRAEAEHRFKNRGKAERVLDAIARWKLLSVLSYPTILGKLTAAAAEGIMGAGLEGVAARGMSPFLPKGIREGAIRYGRGTTASIEAEALANTIVNGVKNFKDALKTGNLELDLAYGKPEVAPKQLFDWIGNIHYALKTPLMQNEWVRSFKTIMRNEALNGTDVSNPVVMERIKNQAYRYARERLFLEDNSFVDRYRRFVTSLGEVDKETGKPNIWGKSAQTAFKVALPIVRIPSNIIKRTFEHVFGIPKGSVLLIRAFHKGVDTLSAEQKDVIVRNLSRGSVGAALMLYGWFNADNVGGYYQPGEKPDKSRVRYGGMKIFGKEVPIMLLHNPALESIQFGATAKHVFDKMVKKHESPAAALGEAAWASLMGLTEETPFVGEIKRQVKNSEDPGKMLGEIGKSAILGFVQWFAGRLDLEPGTGGFIFDTPVEKFIFGTPRSRKPSGAVDAIKMGIPGLREEVPLKKKSK